MATIKNESNLRGAIMWNFLNESTYNKLIEAYEDGKEYTLDDAREISAFIGWDVSDVYSTSENAGTIQVKGVLTKEEDVMAAIFADANTTYSAIQSAIVEAEADESIEKIIFEIDSPGGSFDGMLETMEAIRNISKPTKAIVKNAASAAYGIASSVNEIVAESKISQVGSVGTVLSMRVDPNVVNITNTQSPKKRPNPETPEGIAAIQEELDAAFDLFAEGIAEGRGWEASQVADKTGNGAVFFAEKALSLGMVDSVEKAEQNTNLQVAASKQGQVKANKQKSKPEGATMNLETLKAEHPTLVEAIRAEAVEGALKAEKERVNGFLELGEGSGDMESVIKAIKEGADLSQDIMVKHMMKAAKKNEIEARGDDNSDAGDGGDDRDEEAKTRDMLQGVFASAANRLNISL